MVGKLNLHALPNGAVAMQHCHTTIELSNRGLPTQEKPVSRCFDKIGQYVTGKKKIGLQPYIQFFAQK